MSCDGPAVNRRAIVIHRFRSALPLFWLLAAAAILLRGAIPAGWMPVAADGGLRIAICSGDGPAMAVLGQDGKLHREAPAETGPRDPCPFAVGLAAADLPPPPAFAIAMPAPAAAPSPAMAANEESIRRSLRPPARGPPALA